VSVEALEHTLFQQLAQLELPVAIYLISRDGRFLVCNSMARTLLELPSQGTIESSITNFWDPSERQALLEQLWNIDSSGERILTRHIRMRVGQRDVYVKESVRSIESLVENRIIGYLGCLVDITEEQRYEKLFDHLHVGIYSIDANEILVRVNNSLVKILGYDSKDQVEGRRAREFYANPEEEGSFRELVKNHAVAKQIKELVKKNGEFLFALVSTVAVISPDGEYEGRDGALIDVTNEERYKRSLNDVGVGFYVIGSRDGVDTITYCNQQFARTLGYDTENELIGRDIQTLYTAIEDHERFMRALIAKDAAGNPLRGYVERLVTHKGDQILVEVSSRLLKDRFGKIVGRTGVLSDITEEGIFREELKTFQKHIGQVLHNYSSTLLKARHTFAWVGSTIGPDPFESQKIPTLDEIEAHLKEPVQRLTLSLAEFVGKLKPYWQDRGISQEQWDLLCRLLANIENFNREIEVREHHAPFLRGLARELIQVCGTIQEAYIPREPVRKIIREASDLERIVCLASLHQAESIIVAMDHEVATLRDFLIATAEPQDRTHLVPLWSLVRQAMSNLKEFAHSQGVEFRANDESRNVQVEVVERDCLRALSSLLHNAIKYSWKRGNEPPWVQIRAHMKEGMVTVEFENYGVPIPKDEIESGLIFRFGFRGRYSGDRGRLGTGIGLTDARDIAQAFGGNVTIESRPAWRGVSPGDYSVPYITTASFSLPM